MLHRLSSAMARQQNQFRECQRVQVVKEGEGDAKVVKIVLERFDPALGWYLASAMKIPLHQLPLLQQTLCDLNAQDCSSCTETHCHRKIVPFPTVTKLGETAAEPSV